MAAIFSELARYSQELLTYLPCFCFSICFDSTMRDTLHLKETPWSISFPTQTLVLLNLVLRFRLASDHYSRVEFGSFSFSLCIIRHMTMIIKYKILLLLQFFFFVPYFLSFLYFSCSSIFIKQMDLAI